MTALDWLGADPAVRGVAVGLAVAAPIGPMGLMCIQRSLADGAAAGLATGLGAATVHGAYAALAASGLAVVADALPSHAPPMRLVGAGLLLWFALRIARRPVPSAVVPAGRGSVAASYASAVMLGLVNPLTLVFFLALVPTLAAGQLAAGGHVAVGNAAISGPETVRFAAGVSGGSVLWWTLLTFAVTALRHRLLRSRRLALVNRITAALLAGFAASLLVTEWGAASQSGANRPLNLAATARTAARGAPEAPSRSPPSPPPNG